MPWSVSFLLMFVVMISLFAIGVPIGFAMMAVTVGGMFIALGPAQALDVLTSISYHRITPYIFIAIPLYIVMTELMTQSGISNKLITMSLKAMGRVPGGLAVVTVVASAFFGAVCNNTVVGALAMGEMIFPEAKERKYNMKFIAGCVAAGGTLSTMIPPSGSLLLFGIISGVGIGQLFMAGVLPGALAAVLMIVYIMIVSKRDLSLAPVMPTVPLKERIIEVIKGWEVVFLITIVIGGIYAGIATVTEIAGVGALLALIIGMAHGKLPLVKVLFSFKRTAEMIGSFISILIGAYIMMYLLGYLMIPQNLSRVIVDANLSATSLILVVMVLYFILGCFLESSAVMLLTIPLFLPSLQALHVNLIWFAIILNFNWMIATLTPPVGMNLFVISAIGKPHGISFANVVRGSVPFILLILLAAVLVYIFPSIATWLPNTMN